MTGKKGQKKEYVTWDKAIRLKAPKVKDFEIKSGLYQAKDVGALDRMLIEDIVTSTRHDGTEKRDAIRMFVLLLQKGIVKPDFSQRSEEEIRQWMQNNRWGDVLKAIHTINSLGGLTIEDAQELGVPLVNQSA